MSFEIRTVNSILGKPTILRGDRSNIMIQDTRSQGQQSGFVGRGRSSSRKKFHLDPLRSCGRKPLNLDRVELGSRLASIVNPPQADRRFGSYRWSQNNKL